MNFPRPTQTLSSLSLLEISSHSCFRTDTYVYRRLCVHICICLYIRSNYNVFSRFGTGFTMMTFNSRLDPVSQDIWGKFYPNF